MNIREGWRFHLCGSASHCVEHLSSFQHTVHDNRKLSGDRDRGALEAQPLTQFKPPAPETVIVPGTGSCEDHRRRFVKQSRK
jgi:hypothetical protein